MLHENTVAKIEIRRDDGTEQLAAILGNKERLEQMRASVPPPAATGSWSAWAGSYFSA